ncbi:DUF4190 domain-containing protein [Candidatus Omnitrophota bacterium]
MTEVQKKTLGLAIASLVFGCLVLFPFIGILFSLAAIILGIIALVKISNNKETLKGNGLAIAGIILGGIGVIVIPIFALLAAIAIPNLLRARISANDAAAQATLLNISAAAETYAVEAGQYPISESDLTVGENPYLNQIYNDQTIQGHTYSLRFDANGYEVVSRPVDCGVSGEKIFTITTGGVQAEADCELPTNEIPTLE